MCAAVLAHPLACMVDVSSYVKSGYDKYGLQGVTLCMQSKRAQARAVLLRIIQIGIAVGVTVGLAAFAARTAVPAIFTQDVLVSTQVQRVLPMIALFMVGFIFTVSVQTLHAFPSDCTRLKAPCACHGIGLCSKWPALHHMSCAHDACNHEFFATVVSEYSFNECLSFWSDNVCHTHACKLRQKCLECLQLDLPTARPVMPT